MDKKYVEKYESVVQTSKLVRGTMWLCLLPAKGVAHVITGTVITAEKIGEKTGISKIYKESIEKAESNDVVHVVHRGIETTANVAFRSVVNTVAMGYMLKRPFEHMPKVKNESMQTA